MTDQIKSLTDVRPGDLYIGPIGGLVGVGVALGEIALGEGFRAGKLSARHVGIVTQASQTLPPGSVYRGQVYETGVITAPRMAQAMPGGAEVIDLSQQQHWTARNAFVRLPEDYPGQAQDAAWVALAMVAEGVAYSPLSYGALAAWHWGWRTGKLEGWIDRRRPWERIELPSERLAGVNPVQGEPVTPAVGFPVEAICSVFADQAWSLAGKRVMEGVPRQVVTPGAMALQLWRRPGVVWGGYGLL